MALVLGIHGGFRQGGQDSSAALLKDGAVVSAVEEERFSRIKHAPGRLPEHAIRWILKSHRLFLGDIDHIASHGSSFGKDFERRLKRYFLYRYGPPAPPLSRFPHHLCHAACAFYGSGFDSSMILTADSSGDGISTQTAVGEKGGIQVLKQYKRPQSLGIFYSMITQFCGFQRDRDEYKLMGLSAYGDKEKFEEKLRQVLKIEKKGLCIG